MEPMHTDPMYLKALAELQKSTVIVAPLPPKCRVAVLPFLNAGQDPEVEYLVDGVTENLIMELANQKQLMVYSRSSAFTFKGRNVSAKEVGKELGADFVVDGSIRRGGQRIRVSVQLTDCETGASLWSKKFDVDGSDLLGLEDDLATSLYQGLCFNIDVAAAQVRGRHPASNNDAYTLYLKGRAAWRKGEELEAHRFMHGAIEADPTFAAALSYLAFYYAYSRFSFSTGLEDEEVRSRASELGRKALLLGREDAYTLTNLSAVSILTGRPEEGLVLAEAAASLFPSDIEMITGRGLALTYCGEHVRGIREFENAFRAERHLPVTTKAGLFDAKYMARDYSGALNVIADVPILPAYFLVSKAAAIAQIGRTDDAREAVRKAISDAPQSFDPAAIARMTADMCLKPEDSAHWLDGFAKAGISV